MIKKINKNVNMAKFLIIEFSLRIYSLSVPFFCMTAWNLPWKILFGEEPLKVCITCLELSKWVWPSSELRDSQQQLDLRLPCFLGILPKYLPMDINIQVLPLRLQPARNFPFLSACPCTLWACLTSSHNYISQFLIKTPHINIYGDTHTHTHTHTHTNLTGSVPLIEL